MRINKYLAQCGVASRRECDRLIAEGKVTVNGRPAGLGDDVNDGDNIKVEGRPVSVKKNEYYLLHKPKGYLCTVSDDKGRKTVMDILGDGVGRVYPVGRLDYDSEGLLILTTDGELAQHLTHPSNEVPKTYLVKVEGRLTEADLNPIRSGIEIDGYVTKSAGRTSLKPTRTTRRLSWFCGREKPRNTQDVCGDRQGGDPVKAHQGWRTHPPRTRQGRFQKAHACRS